jgi:mitofusin
MRLERACLTRVIRLITAIDDTQGVIGDIRDFNKRHWTIRYPQFAAAAEEPVVEEAPVSRRARARRSLSFMDDPSAEHDVVFSRAKHMQRSMTLATVADIPEDNMASEPSHMDECLIPTSHSDDFHVLRLDLNLGPNGTGVSPAALVSQLERSSIANLLDERFQHASEHVSKLRLRVEDTSSKVLVTGDLNAGKSTFVNALLRREVMPVDQQPCTTAFCEVHDAAENDHKEEVHIVKDGVTYNATDDSTFVRAQISDLESIISENEDANSAMKLKVYLADATNPEQSLLNNGVVDISLIDAPGLNRDNAKTTAVFARQEEIDVVVFVASAENHLTLSGKDFLFTAANEKAYIFVVVNKYDGIRDKAKCRRNVLEQIRQLSPRTYEHADELVHFVDSAHSTEGPAFAALQSALRTFVLEKRGKSKFGPVGNYLSHLLNDIELLVGANAIVAQQEHDVARDELARVQPVLEQMHASRDLVEEGIESIEDNGAKKAATWARHAIEDGLARVSQGELADSAMELPAYPGLLKVWDYAKEVRLVMLESVDAVIRACEDEARNITSAGVDAINQLGETHLPAGTERNHRVFMPEAMFRPIAGRRARRMSTSSAPAAALGTTGLGLALARRADLLETTALDIFDAPYVFWAQFAPEKVSSADEDEASATALGVLGLSLGTLSLVGGNALGARGLLEGAVRLSELLGNARTRRWAAPLVAALALAGATYVLADLPQSVPRTVGRRLRRELAAAALQVDGAGLLATAPVLADAHAERVARETRKVLRLAGFDLKERFRGAHESHARAARTAEEEAQRAARAQAFFAGTAARAAGVRRNAGFASARLGF